MNLCVIPYGRWMRRINSNGRLEARSPGNFAVQRRETGNGRKLRDLIFATVRCKMPRILRHLLLGTFGYHGVLTGGNVLLIFALASTLLTRADTCYQAGIEAPFNTDESEASGLRDHVRAAGPCANASINKSDGV